MWVTLCFDSDENFVHPRYEIEYDGHTIEIIRGDHEKAHNMCTQVGQDDYNVALEFMCRCLSEISWLYNTRMEFLTSGGGGHKIPVNVQGRFYRILNAIDLTDYKQIAFNKKQKLALGIYREAVNSKSIFYRYLSFSRIINIMHKSGWQQKEWINTNLSKIKQAEKIVDSLHAVGIENIGKHIYESGRCAIAHATYSSGDVADSDSMGDRNRLDREMNLIQELAQIYIKDVLYLRDMKYWYYEWRSFRFIELIRPMLLSLTFQKQNNFKNKLFVFGIRLRKSLFQYPSFSSLNFVIHPISHTKLLITTLEDELIHIKFIFDVNNWSFEVKQGDISLNDSYITPNISLIKEYYRFLHDLFRNDEIVLYDPSTKAVLARTTPFLPMNINVPKTLEGFRRIISG